MQLDQLADVLDHGVRVPERRVIRASRHPRADDLVVVELHAVGGDLRASSACRCRAAGRRGAAPGPARTAPRRRTCGAAHPCAGARGPARAAAPDSSGRNMSERPVSTSSASPFAGWLRADEQLVELRRGSVRPARSSRRSRIARDRSARRARRARRPAAPRTARRAIIRSGSSENATSGSSGVSRTLRTPGPPPHRTGRRTRRRAAGPPSR